MSTKCIRVFVDRQELEFLEDGKVIWKAPVSTAKNGLGEEPDSYKTPRGKHHIDQKIGGGESVGAVFKGRKPTGKIWKKEDGEEENLITTRILTLDGDEEKNKTTKPRYVYIHGTNRESLLGQATSRGCIHLSNQDILKLFELAEEGTPVEIVG